MAVVTMHAASFPRCSIVSLVYSTPLGLTWVACTRTGNSIANVNVTRQRMSLLGRLNDNDGEDHAVETLRPSINPSSPNLDAGPRRDAEWRERVLRRPPRGDAVALTLNTAAFSSCCPVDTPAPLLRPPGR